MTYSTVFSVADWPPTNWTDPGFGLIFVALGVAIAFAPGFFATFARRSRAGTRWLGWSFVLFGCVWTAAVGFAVFGPASSLARELAANRFQTVEGRVAHFIPAPAEGHALESFDVNGVEFAYSDYILEGGFNRTASHGGPIREGLPVRIAYTRGLILRLEVGR